MLTKKLNQPVTNNQTSVEFKSVDFYRDGKKVLDQVSLKIPRGKITGIMGPSGVGKTTLLYLIGGKLKPDSGSILVNNQDLTLMSQNQIFDLRRQLGMLFQSGALFTDLSVFDNVAFPLREHTDLAEDIIRILVLIKLQAVGLRGAANLMPNQLSGGMARRIALARAIALDPQLILYDEPFTGQDPVSMGVLMKLIRRLNSALRMTSVIVSHDIQETCSIADYVYLLGQGKIIQAGSPNDLISSSDPWVMQFMRGLADGPMSFHYPNIDYKKELFASDF